MNVRLATIDDFPDILEMSREFYAHTSYQSIPFDDASCYLLFKSSVEQDMSFVSEKGEVTGFITGLHFPYPMNQLVQVSSEIAWWVKPAYRGTSAGIKLVKALEEAARSAGSKMLTMMCLESINPDSVQAVYEKMGFAQSERAFVRTL